MADGALLDLVGAASHATQNLEIQHVASLHPPSKQCKEIISHPACRHYLLATCPSFASFDQTPPIVVGCLFCTVPGIFFMRSAPSRTDHLLTLVLRVSTMTIAFQVISALLLTEVSAFQSTSRKVGDAFIHSAFRIPTTPAQKKPQRPAMAPHRLRALKTKFRERQNDDDIMGPNSLRNKLADVKPGDPIQQQIQQPSVNRRVFMGATAAAVLAGTSTLIADNANAMETLTTSDNVPLPWETNPVNKRSGVTVTDVEKSGYNVAFVTYLSRFLLNFDTNCQKFWFTSVYIPKTASAEELEQIRLEQFAAFSASVELGLRQYNQVPDGPKILLQELVRKYGNAIPSAKASTGDGNIDEEASASKRRIAKSARRHIALLFALMEKNQPTPEITKLLASVDNGSIESVKLNNETAALLQNYEPGESPEVTFNPPQAGDEYQRAEGMALMKPTGGLLRVDVIDGGNGYSSSTNILVTVSDPPSPGGTPAKVQVIVSKGSVESLKVVNPGSGYTDESPIYVTIQAPSKPDGSVATATPVLSWSVDSIKVTKGGSGYAMEKPLKVFVSPPESQPDKKNSSPGPVLIGLAYPVAEKSSFTAFRKEDDTKKLQDLETDFEKKYNLMGQSENPKGLISGIESGSTPSFPVWSGRSSSSAELLRLLPSGVGLEYDTATKRYALAMDTDFMKKYPAFLQQGSNRVIGTEFGPRGRAPIERDMKFGTDTYLRFCLSGATCASLVHISLTPLEFAKTKLQTAPDQYPNIGEAFKKSYQQDGIPTFFTGWLPTLLGNFAQGGVVYVTTEFIRRYLSELAGVDALNLEVPIILAAAAVASALGAVLIFPFEAVRIRTVAQPEYAPNSIEVLKRMVKEEGTGSLTDAIPVFLLKNVPYAMTKFTIFGKSTSHFCVARLN